MHNILSIENTKDIRLLKMKVIILASKAQEGFYQSDGDSKDIFWIKNYLWDRFLQP
jgi:hypothetical protein